MRFFLFVAFLLYINAFAEKTTVLYIGGDYPSIKYHLGVLSEIERLQISIDTVVGSDWGAFAGALWSAGWSSRQIGELVDSWDSLPRAEQSRVSALWKKRWLIKSKENGEPILESVNDDKPYFGQAFFNLRVEESLWRSDIGSKIAFKGINAASGDWLATDGFRILSTPVALRDTSGSLAERYKQKLLNQDSTLLILRPHLKPNPDSLFETGVRAVQTKRSALAELHSPLSTLNSQLAQPPPPRFLYLPVFDSVSSEIQGHLESFWNPNDTAFLAVRNFLEALQEDDSYQEVKLVLDTASFLQINAVSSPRLSLSLQGFGGTLFGTNIAANVNFRFINQFGYNWDITAFYGQGARGIDLDLRFEQFYNRSGVFFVKSKIFEYEPISFFQKNIPEEARLLIERGSGVALGVEMSRLQIAVEIERRRITSGASGYIIYDYFFDEDENWMLEFPVDVVYEPVTVISMFPYAKWLWQSESYSRWFASDGFMAELSGGFKGVSINTYGSSTPLYVSTQGKLGIAHPLSRYVSVSGGTEFGFNFRRKNNGKIILPDELYGIYSDPALDNRYRFAMGMGCYQEQWQTPDNASHRYGLAFAGLSLHWQGSGIFLAGGFAKDGEPNPWYEHNAGRFFAEPKLRLKTQTFDLVLGQNMIYSGRNDTFLTVQSQF
ncbi:MAG: hypothetical protein FWB90_03070 [Fibromonadales bacterium]|nr:hypothetical protein [Fibromonadales bacterium]